MKVNDAAIVI